MTGLADWLETSKSTWWCIHCQSRQYEVGPDIKHGWASKCPYPAWLKANPPPKLPTMVVSDVDPIAKTITISRVNR